MCPLLSQNVLRRGAAKSEEQGFTLCSARERRWRWALPQSPLIPPSRGQLYVLGRFVEGSQRNSRMNSDFFCYDVESGTWQCLQKNATYVPYFVSRLCSRGLQCLAAPLLQILHSFAHPPHSGKLSPVLGISAGPFLFTITKCAATLRRARSTCLAAGSSLHAAWSATRSTAVSMSMSLPQAHGHV